jgi:hypothetical protein
MSEAKQPEAPAVEGYRIDPTMPLHRLAEERIKNGRDLKLIITAKDSQTGVGKTTLAGWLALQWTEQFTDHSWWVSPDEYGEGMGTLNPKEYFSILGKIPSEYGAGTVVIVDDAEELDARRSMQGLNVEFSQRWMLMRLKQAITIITLPSPKAIDSRLEELSDVWINIERRGRGLVHDIRVNSYGSRNVMTEQKHKIVFPDVSDHPELEKLRRMKEAKMEAWDTAEQDEQEEVDPDEVERDTKIQIAQRMRNNGVPIESQDPDTQDIAGTIGMSQSWISKNTTPSQD